LTTTALDALDVNQQQQHYAISKQCECDFHTYSFFNLGLFEIQAPHYY